MSERVGFAGLGRMGLPMAQRLIDGGREVTVFNRTPARAAELTGEFAVAESPRALAADCPVVITMLADGGAAIAVYEGPDGLLAGIGPDSVVIDMSTIGPALSRGLAEQVRAAGATMLDAPVSGSVPAAQAGTLVAMVGGDAAALARVDGVLAAMTADRIHLGPSGAGAAMKLALNGVLAAFNAALAEALVLAERAGIDRVKAWDVFAASAIGAPFVNYKRDAFLGEAGGDAAFTTAGMRKDVNLAIALGQELGVPLHTAGAANALLTMAAAAGHGDSDFASVSHVLRDLADGPG